MVDREQSDARRLADVIAQEQDTGHDRAIAAVAGLVLLVVLGLGGAVPALGDLADDLGQPVAGLLAAVIALPIAGSVYSLRRAASAQRTRVILTNLTTHDPLTGLPNRRFLGAGYESIASQTHRHHTRLAALFVDLDGLRAVNARYGHETGDQVLVDAVRRLRAVLRDIDIMIRYSGDAFVILCPDVSNAKAGEAIAQRLLGAVREPFERNGEVMRLNAAIGVAISSEHPESTADVLEDADLALFQAKQAGSGTVVLFDESARGMLTPANAQRRLQHAMDQGEFTVYYEPIVSLWTKRLVGVEALLRWDDPDRGLVRPQEFIPLLEETGLIIPVGAWFMEEVLRQSAAWQQRFPGRPPMNIKINVSPRQITDQHFVATLQQAFERTSARPDNLCLEFAEAAMAEDPEVALDNLHAAKALGVTLGLDEFGTGYSSLSFLRAFTLDLLKLDQSFIEQIVGSKEDVTILEHVVALARSMGVATVAYGIQNQQQVDLLRSLNCDLGQGPHFSPPQPPSVIEELLGGDPREDEWRPPGGAAAATATAATAAGPTDATGAAPQGEPPAT